MHWTLPSADEPTRDVFPLVASTLAQVILNLVPTAHQISAFPDNVILTLTDGTEVDFHSFQLKQIKLTRIASQLASHWNPNNQGSELERLQSMFFALTVLSDMASADSAFDQDTLSLAELIANRSEAEACFDRAIAHQDAWSKALNNAPPDAKAAPAPKTWEARMAALAAACEGFCDQRTTLEGKGRNSLMGCDGAWQGSILALVPDAQGLSWELDDDAWNNDQALYAGDISLVLGKNSPEEPPAPKKKKQKKSVVEKAVFIAHYNNLVDYTEEEREEVLARIEAGLEGRWGSWPQVSSRAKAELLFKELSEQVEEYGASLDDAWTKSLDFSLSETPAQVLSFGQSLYRLRQAIRAVQQSM